MRWFPVLSLALFFPLALHAEKKAPPITVRLHAEGNPKDQTFVTPIKLTFPAKETVIRKVPILNERNFKAFYPFHANDGSLGAYFLLDADGEHKLTQHCVEFRDTMGVILINGRVACAVMIDKKSNDSIFYVPSGFLPSEIIQLQEKYPMMGREKEFADSKKFKFPFFNNNKKPQSSAPAPTPQKKP